MSLEFEPCTDEYLTKLWEHINWDAAEQKLLDMQAQISRAAYRKDTETIETLQQTLVCDLDVKCLAVRHVTSTSCSPGVDGIKWRTPSEKMRAAMSLTSKNYKPSPLRQIRLVAKNTGRERYPQLPTYYDRAMSVLYGYSLIPVTEAYAERKSFAFRPGRSTQDAHAYVIELIRKEDAPDFVFYGDVKACYANIQHDWLIAHAPMNKQVLSKFLSAGIVYDGELFPSAGTGISEGSNLSPYLANFTLDGMQNKVYETLHGTTSAPIPELTDRKKSRKLESKGAHAMEQKKMKKRTAPPRYDDAFKAGAVRLVTEQGRQPVEVAKELGICIDTLRSWLKASGVQMGQVSRQNREQKRIRELEAENRSLRKLLSEKDEVIDVLKKSVGILSKP